MCERMYLDVSVSFLQVILDPFGLQVTCLALEFPGLMLFVHTAIPGRFSSNMLTPCCGDAMISNILIV